MLWINVFLDSSVAGKKVKKSKGKTLNLNDFLADETTAPIPGQAVIMAPRKITSWADEVENDDDCKLTSVCLEMLLILWICSLIVIFRSTYHVLITELCILIYKERIS